MERLENDRFEQFVCTGVHVRGCRRTNRPASTRVVVVDTELTVVVVRSRQLKRRPNLIGISRLTAPQITSSSVFPFFSFLNHFLNAFLEPEYINQTGFLFVHLWMINVVSLYHPMSSAACRTWRGDTAGNVTFDHHFHMSLGITGSIALLKPPK